MRRPATFWKPELRRRALSIVAVCRQCVCRYVRERLVPVLSDADGHALATAENLEAVPLLAAPVLSAEALQARQPVGNAPRRPCERRLRCASQPAGSQRLWGLLRVQAVVIHTQGGAARALRGRCRRGHAAHVSTRFRPCSPHGPCSARALK